MKDKIDMKDVDEAIKTIKALDPEDIYPHEEISLIVLTAYSKGELVEKIERECKYCGRLIVDNTSSSIIDFCTCPDHIRRGQDER